MSARTARRPSVTSIPLSDNRLDLARRIAARHVALAAAAGFGLAASPAFAATFTVNQTGDGGDFTCDATCTLRDAIESANLTTATDTVKFSATTFPATTQTEILLGGSEIEITESLIITGPGSELVAVDGDGSSRVFNVERSSSVTPITVSISGLTIRDGTDSEGAGVRNKNEKLTITNCVITGNTATADSGGGVYSDGPNSTLVIKDSFLTANNAAQGAGLYVDDTSGTAARAVHISGSRFANNTATANGGGIYLDDVDAPVLIENTTIRGNDADDGAGIFIYNGDPRARIQIRNSSISSNAATADGGGMFVYRIYESLSIDNTTISDNSAADDGGGIYLYSDFYDDRSIKIRNTTIADNSATDSGGGVFLYYATPQLQNVIVADNSAGTGDDLAETSGVFFTEFTLVQGDTSGTIRDLPGTGSNGSNIDGANPLLTDLQNNGGSLLTHHLNPGSPAIDRGANNVCTASSGATTAALVADSRGQFRPVDGDADLVKVCDMGATEFNGRTTACSSSPETSCDTTFTAGSFAVTDNILANTSDAFMLTLTAGTSTDETLFGTPTVHDGTATVVCVYFDNTLVAQYGAAAGELSTTNAALWKQTAATGAVTNTYTNSSGNADGVTKLVNKASTTANGSSASAAAKGVRAPDYTLPASIATDVDVQVQTSDIYDDGDRACATASFPAANITETQTATARTIKGKLP